MTGPRNEFESYLTIVANEKAIVSQRPSIPGDSPAYYTGDPSNDVLEIKALDLTPNPPIVHFTLELRGEIKSDIGLNPQLRITAYLNGRLGPTTEGKLCPDRLIEIIQKGGPLADGQAPTKGKVTIRYKNYIPYTWYKKGWYTIRVEMYASEEVGKVRMTGFEGGIWIEGGTGDGCGGWV